MLTKLSIFVLVVVAVPAAIVLPSLSDSRTPIVGIFAVAVLLVAVLLVAVLLVAATGAGNKLDVRSYYRRIDRVSAELEPQTRRKPVPMVVTIVVGLVLIALGVFDLYVGERLPWAVSIGFIVSGSTACGVPYFIPESLLRALRVTD